VITIYKEHLQSAKHPFQFAKVVQGERSRKAKPIGFTFPLPNRSLPYLKVVQGERSRKAKPLGFAFLLPNRSLPYPKVVQGKLCGKGKAGKRNIKSSPKTFKKGKEEKKICCLTFFILSLRILKRSLRILKRSLRIKKSP